jgi:hypothetical protein
LLNVAHALVPASMLKKGRTNFLDDVREFSARKPTVKRQLRVKMTPGVKGVSMREVKKTHHLLQCLPKNSSR